MGFSIPEQSLFSRVPGRDVLTVAPLYIRLPHAWVSIALTQTSLQALAHALVP